MFTVFGNGYFFRMRYLSTAPDQLNFQKKRLFELKSVRWNWSKTNLLGLKTNLNGDRELFQPLCSGPWTTATAVHCGILAKSNAIRVICTAHDTLLDDKRLLLSPFKLMIYTFINNIRVVCISLQFQRILHEIIYLLSQISHLSTICVAIDFALIHEG